MIAASSGIASAAPSSTAPSVSTRQVAADGRSHAAEAAGRTTQDTYTPSQRPEDRERAQPSGNATGSDGKPLSEDEQRMLRELQARDREVRAHESAHKSAAGSLAGGMSFSYQTGPDGRRYAIGGEVQIDTGAESSPQATIAKMQQVISAALAAADPSAQDHAVAAEAQAALAEARRKVAEQGQEPTGATPRNDRAGQAYGQQPDQTGTRLSLIA